MWGEQGEKPEPAGAERTVEGELELGNLSHLAHGARVEHQEAGVRPEITIGAGIALPVPVPVAPELFWHVFSSY